MRTVSTAEPATLSTLTVMVSVSDAGKRKIGRLRLISTNGLPEYQKWGLGVVTLARILPDAISYGIKTGEFSWVLESNSLSCKTIERGGAQRTRRHRIYDRSLSDL